jgi:lycopene beta-cyclase
MKPSYDFVIAGGGLAGLSLACHLVRSPLCGASILIVERNPQANQGRLWSYWTHAPTLFDPIVQHAWPRLRVANTACERTYHLPGGRFELVRGGDLQAFAARELGLHADLDWWRGSVERIDDGQRGACVTVDGQRLRAGWVFDSTRSARQAATRRQPFTMYFYGWTVETREPSFDPQAITFLDTRTPQSGELRFFYVMPFSERRALVEYVTYSRARPAADEAESAAAEYFEHVLKLNPARVSADESGCLPIATGAHPRRLGRHHMAIGARAGLVKPSTGYGFRRIQQDSAAIVRSLADSGQPWGVPPVPARHRLYDALLLDVLARRGPVVAEIFAALFARNPLGRVLRFLDETTTPAEEAALIATLPAGPFLAAMPRLLVSRGQAWPKALLH